MTPQQHRGARFRALHERDEPFILPNPWDAGTARLLETAGFDAVATTSAGHAASLGRPDGTGQVDEVLEHVRRIVDATGLPVSVDLEHGYGDDPAAVADVIARVAGAGAVGGSIEDLDRATGELFDLHQAVERVVAAAEAVRELDADFVLTARCESFVAGRPDLATTIRRLQAYQEAGADVLYAPGLSTADEIAAVVTSLDRPVNVVMGLGGPTWSVEALGRLGVRRISLGSALQRTAYGAFLRAVDELLRSGTFGFADDAVPYAQQNELLAAAART